jgi:predicted XRE-type DNA-binding protein
MKQEEMTRALKMHIIKTHGTQAKAAQHWGVSQPMLSRVMNHKVIPSEAMMADLGVELVEAKPTYKRVKKEKAK